jgi:hypothetical protein
MRRKRSWESKKWRDYAVPGEPELVPRNVYASPPRFALGRQRRQSLPRPRHRPTAQATMCALARRLWRSSTRQCSSGCAS